MKRGFTLIEMSVVLLVIALVTHLAFRQLGAVRDAKLVAAADRQLSEIRDAVYSVDRDGEPTGFLADMGRLVAATNGTLSELWRLPAGARQYAVRPALRENYVAGVADELENGDVRVATGWRGPYLRLPVGRSRLTDPWGNPLESPDTAGFDRLAVTNGVATAVSHFGPTALPHDERRRTLALAPERGASSRLFVQVVSRSGASLPPVDYCWYGPCDGLITGACEKAVQYGRSCAFEGLTPGRRVLWDSASRVSRLVTVLPGDNQVEVAVP